MSAIIRYERPLNSLADMVDEMFNQSWFGFTGRDITNSRWPLVDVVEEQGAFKLRADLPGVDKKDINVTVEKGVLTIRGRKESHDHEKRPDSYGYFERAYGEFCRSFNLPENVDGESVEATYRDGVLELTLRKNEKAKPRAIEVKVA